jgi:Na+/proline symporter/signal transduction histidine kinase
MQLFLNVDVILFLSFLIINLIVGLTHSNKITNIKEYALGGRNFSTGALVATLVATWVSGSSFFITLSKTYKDGFTYFIASSCASLSFLIIAVFIIPKMKDFLGKVSSAEVMGELYGDKIKLAVATCLMIGKIGYIAVQFKVFGTIFEHFIGLDKNLAILSAGSIVTIYSAFGGIKAVTHTDIIQFFTFGVIIPIVGLLIWLDFNNSNLTLKAAFSNKAFDFSYILSRENPKLLDLLLLICYFIIPTINVDIFQRFSMARSLSQAKTSFVIAAVIIFAIKIFVTWIPFLLYQINPNLNQSELVHFIVNTYTYNGLKGLIMIGVAAMAMSSADSAINASSVLFSNDFVPFFKKNTDKLFLSKAYSLILGTFAMYMAFNGEDLLKIIMSTNKYSGIAEMSFLMTVLGLRTNTKAISLGMISSLIFVFSAQYINFSFDVNIPAMFLNALVTCGYHYFFVKKEEYAKLHIIEQSYEDFSPKQRYSFFDKLKKFNLIEYLKITSPKNELLFIGFGIYSLVYAITSMYIAQEELKTTYSLIYLFQIMLVTSLMMIMRPIWPVSSFKSKTLEAISWHTACFYMLIPISCFLVFLSKFHNVQFMMFSVNIIIYAILTNWKCTISLVPFGTYLGISLFKQYKNIDHIDSSYIQSSEMFIMYSMILVASIVVIFLKPYQDEADAQKETIDHLGGKISFQENELENLLKVKSEVIKNINHELKTPASGILGLSDLLYNDYDAFSNDDRKEIVKNINESSVRMSSLINNILDFSNLSSANYNLKIEQLNLTELVHERIEKCKKLYLKNKHIDFYVNAKEDIIIYFDAYYMRQVLDNLITNAIVYSDKGSIIITIIDNEFEVEFKIEDEGVGIPKEDLYNIFKPFVVSSKTKVDYQGRGIGLSLCEKILSVHKGKIWAEEKSKGACFRFIMEKEENM